MKPITNEYGLEKTVLKHFPYLGAACLVPTTMATTIDPIVPAGTPFPSNDGDCVGLLLHDVDTSNGDAPGTYVYEGDIDNAKLTERGITVGSSAKAAIPRVTFFD